MLGFDNPIHIAFILILLLLVFGAKRLPEMGKSLGSGMRGFKESLSGEHGLSTLTAAPPAAAPVPTPVTATPAPVAAAAPVQGAPVAEPVPVAVAPVAPVTAPVSEPGAPTAA